MHETMLEFLRCPFCWTRMTLVENDALVRAGDRVESGVLGCECCAFPIVAGIPVMIADDPTREAMHLLEAGQSDAALYMLLGLDGARAEAFRALLARNGHPTYQDALGILSQDAEGTCFVYRFSDPTFVMAEALLHAIDQDVAASSAPRGILRCLDVCGGTGHL